MTSWREIVAAVLDGGSPAVRVTVIRADGSAPREVGAAMLVRAQTIAGTIGGGRLELEAIAVARAMLGAEAKRDVGGSSAPGEGKGTAGAAAQAWARAVRHYPLGPSLGQCCGGHASLLFERIGTPELEFISALMAGPPDAGRALLVRQTTEGAPPFLMTSRKQGAGLPLPVLRVAREMLSGTRQPQPVLIGSARKQPTWLIEPLARARSLLYLYGAGHVGRAVVCALAELPFDIVWVDMDESRFPRDLPGQARPEVSKTPDRVASSAPPHALHLVMTFSHALDLAICHAILHRGQFAYLGLIGSRTKRVRFAKRLGEAGIAGTVLARLHCPIGLDGVPGKEPAMIAIAVAADLLRRIANARAEGEARAQAEVRA